MGKINLKNFWIVSGALFLFFGLFIIWVFFIGLTTDETGGFYNKGHNAVWIAHEWAEEKKTDREIQDLVVDLEKHDIDTIYLHVGPLKSDGKIDGSTYGETLNFFDKVKRFKNEMKVYAWIGQLRGKINLEVSDVRRNIVNMTMIFTKMMGMDGVHIDIEPVWDGDKDFIKLLAELRDVLDTGEGIGSDRKFLSVALAEFIPSSFVWWVEEVADYKNYNTEVNYLNVAKYADQIVDMVYDTGIDREWLYQWLVKEQVIWITDLLDEQDETGTEFLIGVPAYDDQKEGFNPEVENIGVALVGVINGLNDIRANEGKFTGVAIYSGWEMDENEWEIYDGLWLE